MKIIKVTEELVPAFKSFCIKHRDQVDDSYLTDEDLEEFVLDGNNPSVIGYDQEGYIIAAASLIVDEPNRKARFRILQSEEDDIAIYQLLLKAILEYTPEIDIFTIYGDEPRKEFFEMLTKLGFELERYIYVMDRDDNGSELSVELPEGFSLETMTFNHDEEEYMKIRNAAFSALVGSSPMSLEQVKDMKNWFEHWENGIQFLKHEERKVGLIRMSLHPDGDDGIAAVEPIAILPEYHRKGLGRQLLRAGLKFAQQNGVKKCTLCVNATNEKAADLYKREGFNPVKIVLCWRLDKNSKE
ncbi:MAG: family N-acetyltransferase [Bacillales bacterium]|jgi:mycothiol synthase|nr:family N-acetyltransferase [Bacillales bacterium]